MPDCTDLPLSSAAPAEPCVVRDWVAAEGRYAGSIGALVSEVVEGGPAEDAGVEPGDVILEIVSKGVASEAKSAAQVNEFLAKLEKGAAVTMRLRRGDNQFYATVRMLNGE